MTTSPPSSAHKWWTLTAVCLGLFMLLVDITIVIVALPSIRGALHASFSDVQWTIDAYALSLAALLLPTGSLADVLGRKRVFALGLLVFTLGSLLCGLAQSSLMLILCRALQGIGGATIFATSLALVAQTFQGKERGTAFGIWGAVAGIATAVGPLLGGALTTWLSWRWIFFVNIPIGVIAIAITMAHVSEFRPPQARRIDVPGFLVFTVGLVALVYGLIESSLDGWGSTRVIAGLVVAVVLLVSFPVVERFSRQPMFDLRLFRKPTFVGGSIAAFGMNASLYSMLLYFVLYLQNVDHYSALQTGLRLVVITVGSLLTAIPAGRLSALVPVRWLVGPGLILVGIGLLLMRGIDPGSSWTHLILGFAVAGAGAGMVNPPLASTAVGVVSHQDAGMASGINTTFRQIGIATAIAALGSIFASHLSGATGATLGAHYASALNELLLITAVVALASGVLATILIRQKDFIVQGPPASAESAGGGAGASDGSSGAPQATEVAAASGLGVA